MRWQLHSKAEEEDQVYFHYLLNQHLLAFSSLSMLHRPIVTYKSQFFFVSSNFMTKAFRNHQPLRISNHNSSMQDKMVSFMLVVEKIVAKSWTNQQRLTKQSTEQLHAFPFVSEKHEFPYFAGMLSNRCWFTWLKRCTLFTRQYANCIYSSLGNFHYIKQTQDSLIATISFKLHLQMQARPFRVLKKRCSECE